MSNGSHEKDIEVLKNDVKWLIERLNQITRQQWIITGSWVALVLKYLISG